MNEPVTGALRADIQLIRPGAHGDYPMLFDPHADAYYKISIKSMRIIGWMNESMPITEFHEKLKKLGVDVTQGELMELIAFLQQSNLTTPEYGQVSMKQKQHIAMKEKTTLLRLSAAYLFFKLPPWRPEKFFEKAKPYVDFFASRAFIMTLLVPALIGYALVFTREFGEVTKTFANSLSWAGLAKYFVAIVFLKFAHEAAHAISATHFNCRIRGIGIGFMIFYPRFFTDTTDSWRLPRKQRMLIDGAGIIIELLIGGIAALLWIYLPVGAWKSTMFYVFAVSAISTLFVNGNPCIRYDGYYLLCDFMNIENLMTRSSEYVKQAWRWYFLRLGTRPHEQNGGFLLFFGIISFIYRLFLYTSIILIIYHKFGKFIGVILVFLEIYSIVIYPFYREIKTIRALSKRSANKARWYFALVIVLSVSFIMFLPLSWNISLPGEVVPLRTQQVVILESGYLSEHLPRTPRPVEAGETLFELTSPALDFSIRRRKWELELDQLTLKLQQLDERTFPNIPISVKKIDSDKVAIAEANRRRDSMTLKADFNGIFVPKVRDASEGMFLSKGRIAGEVVSKELVVHAYALDREIGDLKQGLAVTIKLPDTLESYTGKIQEVNQIAATLRNSPLLHQFGGSIPVYMDETKPKEYHSIMALYRIRIIFDESPEHLFAGRTVKVSVHHREQLYDRVRAFVLSAYRREF